MTPKRREFSTNSLSFLDIMSCGLGAAVLLFLILKHDQVTISETLDPASSESMRLEDEITQGQRYLAELKNSAEVTDDELARSRAEVARIEAELLALEEELRKLQDDPELTVTELEDQLRQVENEIAQLKAEQASGSRAREYLGQGQRQYLTGINLGGRHTLILLDRSASMLDETIINVIRRRSRSTDVQLESEKWQRAVKIVDWLTANLPIDTHLQVISFNTTAHPALGDSLDQWVSVNDTETIDQGVDTLRQTVPTEGTSLQAAIEAATQLNPLPDNIFLITDGLPTQGDRQHDGSTVSGRDRVNYFNDAVRELPNRVPVNVMLLPMEGDPLAASAYWDLAIRTQGSFLTPARDWP